MKNKTSKPRDMLADQFESAPDITRSPVFASDGKTVLREAIVQNAEWQDPDDANPNHREAKRITGTRSVDGLMEMHVRSQLVTTLHLKAANSWALDYEMGICGAAPGKSKSMLGGNSFGAKDYPELTRIVRVTRFNETCKLLGPRGRMLLEHLVLGIPDPTKRDIKSLAARVIVKTKTTSRAWSVGVTQGYVLAALDVLVDYYKPMEKPPRK